MATDTDDIQLRRKRGYNWTKNDKYTLALIYSGFHSQIIGKCKAPSGVSTARVRYEAWKSLRNQFEASNPETSRSLNEIKGKIENLKTEARKYGANLRNYSDSTDVPLPFREPCPSVKLMYDVVNGMRNESCLGTSSNVIAGSSLTEFTPKKEIIEPAEELDILESPAGKSSQFQMELSNIPPASSNAPSLKEEVLLLKRENLLKSNRLLEKQGELIDLKIAFYAELFKRTQNSKEGEPLDLNIHFHP